eukprot:TRINITY_DN3294_c0_g1_i1.p6 TRINITY_DN3294_c0_g1~~TRINITY_DN3294_c0_g1_i1.p6  ORF type:complete len:59 (+),score=17.02 TRINITY_DN3294_c0_g1_i1:168-344(+)
MSKQLRRVLLEQPTALLFDDFLAHSLPLESLLPFGHLAHALLLAKLATFVQKSFDLTE